MMDGRARRPYPPIVVGFNGAQAPAAFVNLTPIVVEWKKRDRRKQVISLPSGPDEAVEEGTEFCVRHGPDGFKSTTVLGDASATTGNFNLDFKGYSRVEFFARRDGVESNAYSFDTIAANGAGASVAGALATVVRSGVINGAVTVIATGMLPSAVEVIYAQPTEVEAGLATVSLAAIEGDVTVITEGVLNLIIGAVAPEGLVSLSVEAVGNLGTLALTVPSATLSAAADKIAGGGIYAFPAIDLAELNGSAEEGEVVDPGEAPRSRKTPIFASTSVINQNVIYNTDSATRYFSPVGQFLNYDFGYTFFTTEGNWRRAAPADGKINDIYIQIPINTRALASVFKLRVNGVDTGGVVTVPGGQTGIFSYVGAPIIVNEDDLLSMSITNGSGGGNFYIGGLSMSFEADTDAVTLHSVSGDPEYNYAVSTTHAGQCFAGTMEANGFASGWATLAGGTRQNWASDVLTPGVVDHLRVSVPVNSTTATMNVELYKNGVATGLKVTIPAGTTGVFTDYSTTVNVVAGDWLDYHSYASASGSGSWRLDYIQARITREAGYDLYMARRANSTLQGYSDQDYFMGTGQNFVPTTVPFPWIEGLRMPAGGIVKELAVLYSNAGTGPTGYALTLVKNAVNTALDVFAPTLGNQAVLTDTADVAFDANDYLALKFKGDRFSATVSAWTIAVEGLVDFGVEEIAYSGAAEEIVVPGGATYATVKAWSGAGGAGQYANSGKSGGGGFVQVGIPCEPGDVIKVEVGQGGQPGINPGVGGEGGWPDGGIGSPGDTFPGGGGGSSRVYLNDVLVAVAGAGGGGTGYQSPAGAGGGRWGQDGYGGTGGTQIAGGIKRSAPLDTLYQGGYLQGGDGGPATTGNTPYDGGGGGGGYYGGGGGGGDGQTGGGGSGWVDPAYEGFTSGGWQMDPANETDPDYAAGIGVGQVGPSVVAGGNGRAAIRFAAEAPATAPLAVVQQKSAVFAGGTAGSPLSVTFDTAPTNGNTLIALVMINGATGDNTPASGWTEVTSSPVTAYGYMGCAYFYKTVGAGESATQTATTGSAGADMISMFEVSGIVGSVPGAVAQWSTAEFNSSSSYDAAVGAGYVAPQNVLALVQSGYRDDLLTYVGEIDYPVPEAHAGNRSVIAGYSYRSKSQKMRPLAELDIGISNFCAVSILMLKN